MSSYSLHKTLAPSQLSKAGPINALLFFEDGTRLASGGTGISLVSALSQVSSGDDGNVRIWDVQSGDCQQELHDASWGQITNLDIVADGTGKPQSLLIGTGLGIFSVYPWHERTQVHPLSW